MKAPANASYVLSVMYAVLACFLWGLIFLVSLHLGTFHFIDVVLGRYLCFGLLSAFLLFWSLEGRHERGIFKFWKQAGANAIVMNFIYFSALTVSMRLANPAEIAIIIGLSPITIAIGEMLISGRVLFKALVGPLLCITLGIFLMNVTELGVESSPSSSMDYLLGLSLGFLSLMAWTWYVIYNTRFLQKNPEVNPRHWTLLVGVMTLGLALVGLTARWMWVDEGHGIQFSITEWQGQSFFLGVMTLAVVCSWIAYTLWNVASAKLPSVVSGQIAILEMVFSLLFVYVYRQQWPSLEECVGVGFILLGIWMGLVQFYGEKERTQIDT